MEFVTALRTKTFDAGKPSLFELLSEQQLNSLLPPTLRYLLTVATQRYPRYLLRILNSFDELYALAGLVVEGHYLRTRGGTFTEHFYNLKREKVPLSSALPASTAVTVSGDNPLPRASAAAPSAVRGALRLRSRDVLANLAVSVLFPYLRRKLDDAHDADAPRALLGSAYNTLPPNPTWRDRARHWFRLFLRRGYPWLHAVCGLVTLAFNLAYLFDGSRFHHPLLWLAGTRVRRMTAADHRAIEMLEKGAGAGTGGRGLAARALGGLSILLPTGIFALKFLEWWYASDFARQLSRRAAESLELPPPAVAGLGEADGKGRGRARQASAVSTSSAGSARSRSSRNQDEDHEAGAAGEERSAKNAPIATSSLLPVYTVSAPGDSEMCPICEDEIATPTACQTGVVYCYTCIHRWMTGTHARQERFMAGKEGRWESGAGRCAVTGRRVLGGTKGLRRIMV